MSKEPSNKAIGLTGAAVALAVITAGNILTYNRDAKAAEAKQAPEVRKEIVVEPAAKSDTVKNAIDFNTARQKMNQGR